MINRILISAVLVYIVGWSCPFSCLNIKVKANAGHVNINQREGPREALQTTVSSVAASYSQENVVVVVCFTLLWCVSCSGAWSISVSLQRCLIFKNDTRTLILTPVQHTRKRVSTYQSTFLGTSGKVKSLHFFLSPRSLVASHAALCWQVLKASPCS